MTPATVPRILRAGIVGGGRGAFIGAVHRIAAALDNESTLVAGALSSDPRIAHESAAAWRLERSYDSYEAMARAEAARPDGIDFVIVATPNHLHFPVARAFIEAGIHVVCDKPLTASIADAEQLVQWVEKRNVLFALTHNYTGYPMVRQARDMVKQGLIGEVRKVLVEYQQDWLMAPIEQHGNKQAAWRTDPAKAGAGGCVGDIGTHAENLLEFATGLRIQSLCADLTTFVPGRHLDDDANILLRLQNGAKGTLVCSQIATGEENNLTLRLYGSKAGLEWRQQDPNTLIYKPAGAPWQLFRTAQTYLGDAARDAARLPPGHPEGYLEAFANIYREVIGDIQRLLRGEKALADYPTARDGLRGIQFVAKCVESSKRGAQWLDLP